MDFLKLTDTGLSIASRQEIYEQLCVFARVAYGNDISLDEGSPFNSYLHMLADSLATLNGSVQSFSELFSTKELSGNYLDFVAGRRGIVRKTKSNQKVIMTCTVDGTVIRPFIISKNTIYVKDNFGRTWVNTSQLVIQKFKFLPDGLFDTTENFQGTCEFSLLPLDGYDADLLYANNYRAMTNLEVVAPSPVEVINHFTFINKVNAIPAVTVTENDAQFRARYDKATYSDAVATVEGLKSNLLKSVNYVRIVENLTDSSVVSEFNPYGLDAHSIWCIVDGGSNAQNYGGYLVNSELPTGTDFDSVGLSVGSVIKVGTLGIVIMGDTTRVVGSYWERTGESTLESLTEQEALDLTVSNDSSDITIAQTILNYKSLGCGVSVSSSVVNGTVDINGTTYKTGNFMCEFPIETIIAQIPFTRLVNNEVSFNVVLDTTSLNGSLRDTIREKVSFALQEYVSSLEAGEVITLSAIVSAVNHVLSQYENGLFDFVSSTTAYGIGSGILIYQKAVGGVATVEFEDEIE